MKIKDLLLFIVLLTFNISAQVSLSQPGVYVQDFNTLHNVQASFSSILPPGWAFTESGVNADATYGVDAGGGNVGLTFSYGSSSTSDRSFGTLRIDGGSAASSVIGAAFINNTGMPVNQIIISYTGELWRLGNPNRLDKLDFQYSTDANSLTDGSWTDVDDLDFAKSIIAVVGSKNGNDPANRTELTAALTGLNIPDGAEFRIRWTDFNATGTDDGMAVDEFRMQFTNTIIINSITGYGLVTSREIDNPPANVSGISETTISSYRWIVAKDATITLLYADLKFFLSEIDNPQINENAPDIQFYTRTVPGTGAFSLVGTLTYNNNGTASDQSDDWLSFNNVSSFGEFVFATNGSSPLPVELVSFNAAVKNGSVKLSWQTASEVNNYGFEVQKQVLNIEPGVVRQENWHAIGFVNGNGNSSSVKEYTYIDPEINEGTYLYRLKQIDNDGSYKYSDVVEISVIKPAEFIIYQNYPNPFNPETAIRFTLPSNELAVLKVYNSLGEEAAVLFNSMAEGGKIYQLNFNASGLASGIYLAKLQYGDKSVTMKMLYMK